MIKDSFIGAMRKEVAALEAVRMSERNKVAAHSAALDITKGRISTAKYFIQLSKRYRLDGIVISRECATDAIDEFREELAREETSRDRIADKSSKFWKKYELRAKYWRDKITEITTSLENSK